MHMESKWARIHPDGAMSNVTKGPLALTARSVHLWLLHGITGNARKVFAILHIRWYTS